MIQGSTGYGLAPIQALDSARNTQKLLPILADSGHKSARFPSLAVIACGTLVERWEAGLGQLVDRIRRIQPAILPKHPKIRDSVGSTAGGDNETSWSAPDARWANQTVSHDIDSWLVLYGAPQKSVAKRRK